MMMFGPGDYDLHSAHEGVAGMKLKYTDRLVLEPDAGVLLFGCGRRGASTLGALLGVPVLVRHNDALYSTALNVTPLLPVRGEQAKDA